MADDDNDRPELSQHALAALSQFLSERATESNVTTKDGVIYLKPDWGLSQFWYDDKTSNLVADEAIERAQGGLIGCLCTPSVFRHLTKKDPSAYLFEYDRRFDAFGDKFVYFDLYDDVGSLPESLKGKFKCLIGDPPHLNGDTLAHLTAHINWLSVPEGADVILLTGAVLEEHAEKLLKARRNVWEPTHESPIQNPFACFTNYVSKRFGGFLSSQ